MITFTEKEKETLKSTVFSSDWSHRFDDEAQEVVHRDPDGFHSTRTTKYKEIKRMLREATK